MVKTRFALPDVVALVRDLRPVLLGSQVVNVYDIDSRTYEFKLSLPTDASAAAVALVSSSTSLADGTTAVRGGAGDAVTDTVNKLNLVMESGTRFHASTFTRPHASDAG